MTLLCVAIGLCAGFASCDDDDDMSQRIYNLNGIDYAYVLHTGDGVTTEWKDFSVEYTNDGDTVMTVRYDPQQRQPRDHPRPEQRGHQVD